MKKILFIKLLFGILLHNSFLLAQNTGSFDINISFNGEGRMISFFVPNDYNSTNSYKLLIGLHGLGDNSINYRNSLINYLSWGLIFPNTILAFPDGGNDPARDFYTPENDEQLIIETINYCKQNYNIDESNIILQGFSLGGRSALKFGLDNPDIFKGIILNTPAVQGKMDAMNDPAINFGFNYRNASKLKIAISYGGNDILYIAPIRATFDSLTKHNGIVILQEVEGMQHNIASRPYIEALRNFIENPYPENNKIELLNIFYTPSNCEKNIDIKFNLRNIGVNNVSNLKAKITDGTQSYEKNFNTNLSSFEFYESDINFSLTNEGMNAFNLYIYSMDGNNILSYDSTNFNIWYYPNGLATPYLQDFESEEILSDDWEIIHGAAPLPFYPDNGYNSQNSLTCFNSILLFYNLNTSEQLITPPLNISNLSSPTLYFDYSFNYHLYTPPYFTSNTILTDTLEILISTDCGDNWISLFKKWGDQLSTYSSPIVNPLQITQIWPQTLQWKKESIDLSNFKNSSNLKIKFNYISGLGGAFNIDNISIDEFTNVNEKNTNITLYPNPANDFIIVNFGNLRFQYFELINLIGQILYKQDILFDNDSYKIDVSNIPKGFYILRLYNNDNSTTLRFIKN